MLKAEITLCRLLCGVIHGGKILYGFRIDQKHRCHMDDGRNHQQQREKMRDRNLPWNQDSCSNQQYAQTGAVHDSNGQKTQDKAQTEQPLDPFGKSSHEKYHPFCGSAPIAALIGLPGTVTDDIPGTMLGFHINLPDIFPDDTQGNELDAAHEADNTDGRSPAGNRIAQ